MRIGMIGTGYVGLVSGACFADFGHQVVCVDRDERKISLLQSGHVPIYEPGLPEMVSRNIAEERLSFSTDTAEAVCRADAVFIAVGTPSRRGDGHADLIFVRAAAHEIADLVDSFTVVVTKSTVPVGTGDQIEALMRQRRPEADIAVVSNPEFLREGAAIKDFKIPDRVVVGSSDERASQVMREIYRPLFLNETPMLLTSRRSAEMIKYAANSFLATRIGFINEMSDLCEMTGANIQDVSRGIGLDRRIGSKFLNTGPGYGGSCFPKDTLALSRMASDLGGALPIVDSVIESNTRRKKAMAGRVLAALDGAGKQPVIAVLGLAFKPNTDDIRDAPSLDIIPALQAENIQVRAFDPAAMNEARKCLDNVVFENNPYDCVNQSDAMLILTEWDQFRALDLARVHSLMRTPTIIDLRNIYAPTEMSARGFSYTSLGRPE